MRLSRRDFLRGAGAGALTWWARPAWITAVDALQREIVNQVEGRNIGVDVARLVRDGDEVRELFRVGVNQDALRPTASCFKAWALMYYYAFTPPEVWNDDPDTDPYNVVVNSHNVATGRLIRDVGTYQTFGNHIEKFNDFILYGMRMQHGIASWNWDGNPLVGMVDPRFAAGGERVVRSRGETHEIGNVTTAADTLNGYRELFRRTVATGADAYGGDPTRRRLGALRTMRLLSLPSELESYEAPIERVVGRGAYIGKDGVLPAGSTSAGRVVNDAGFIPMERGLYALAFFSVAESEFSAIEILRRIVAAMYAAEQSLVL